MILLAQIFTFIGIISFLVVIHELGHYFSAKKFKVKVEEFGLGYPPRAMTLFKHAGTIFSLNWIPFGGFVRMEGEEGPVAEEASPAEQKKEGPFYEKSKFARLVIVLAGPIINFLFGVVAFSLFFSIKGIPILVPRIGEVLPETPAAQAQLPVNGEIRAIRVQGQTYTITETDQVIRLIGENLGQEATLTITDPCDPQVSDCSQPTKEYTVKIRQKSEIPQGQGALGIMFAPQVKAQFYPWYEMPIRGAIYGTQQAVSLSVLILSSLGDIAQVALQGKMPQGVAGPVGIFTEARKVGIFSSGILEMINFAGLLSVNLAIVNLLPIPALDGGRAVFILIESIVGKKRIRKYEGYFNYAAFALLLLLTIVITMKDIRQLF